MEAIHAEPKSIRELFSHWEFFIPDFQRPYSWEIDECDKLWDDFEAFYDDKTANLPQYFLGSIVLYPKDKAKNRWQVIDGQQRLTSVLLLSKVMHEEASTYKALEKLYKKVNPQTDEITDELRLSLNKQQKNNEEFRAIMTAGLDNIDEQSIFAVNFRHLQEKFNNWRRGKTSDEVLALIDSWMDSVVLLPIQCNTADHALVIFNTVNDRGMSLNDADIFKAKIYAAIDNADDETAFIEQWNNLHDDDSEKGHAYLFRVYMHILRAKDNETAKEKALRKYMMDRWVEYPEELRDWRSLLETLEVCSYIDYNSTHEKLSAEETIYWAILSTVPNKYWEYPLYVFLQKHMIKTEEQEGWILPEDKHAEYLELMKNTMRYFFIKAVVHNSVNAVKDTTYKVCCSIAKGKNYLEEYAKSLVAEDIQRLEVILQGSNYGRCQKGLVLINSLCNEDQDYKSYAAFLQPLMSASGSNQKRLVQTEHILPQKWWNNYDGWDENLWKKHINLLGNLMPLEKKSNIAASNEFFTKKQTEYKKSKVQDALDLSEKSDKKWYPADVQERHAEAIKRLMKFFSP